MKLNLVCLALLITSGMPGTTCSPDVIHVICVLAQCVVLNTNWRTKNRGGLGTRLWTCWNQS